MRKGHSVYIIIIIITYSFIMEDLQSNKLLPTGNIKPMIHDNFPRQDRKTYVDFSIQDVKPVQIMPENTDLNGISSLEFIIH